MARTRKSIQPLNLYKYDVLIEDTGTRSDYFKVSQFDGYFYGGRNAFLVAGTGVLKPNSKILVEILNKDGTTVYSAPVTSFIEGNSRLVQIEIYSDTPIGAGKIVLLGCTNTYLDGTPVPAEWQDKYNVRWVADIIISPLIENKTPIRFEKNPSLVVNEKFYYLPSASQFTEQIKVPVDIELTPKYYNVFPNGYIVKLKGPSNTNYVADYIDGFITGTITLSNTVLSETASVRIPINKIYNTKLAESAGTLIYTNNKQLILGGVLSSSGTYSTEIAPFGTVTVNSNISIQYNKLTTANTGSAASFAKIRLVDLKTISGEIHKIRLSYKAAVEPGEFISLGDVNTATKELLTTDTGSKIAETGKFTDIKISDYWYSETMSLQKNVVSPTLPAYYNSASLSSSYLPIVQSSTLLLDSITATPQIVNSSYVDDISYFIGTTNNNTIQLFPRAEYTITFEATVNRTSGSITLDQDDYSMEVYLIQQENAIGKLLQTNARGQLLGTLTPTSTFQRQNFEIVEFNFTPKIIDTGNFGLRFVAYGGFWQIANVSVKPAQEPFFSPDEVDILVPNVNYTDKILTFKAEYLDVNNNSIGLSTLSLPTYFTGSESSTVGGSSVSASYAVTSSYSIYAQSALSASWAPSVEGASVAWTSITGKPTGLVSSSTQISTGSFTGSFIGTHSGSTFGTSSWAISASVATTSTNLTGGATNYIPLWTSATAQSSSNIYQSSGNIVVGTDPGGSELLRVGGSIRASGNSHVVGAASSTTAINRPDNTGRFDIGGGASTSATVGARAIFQGVNASAGSRGTLSLSAGLIASPTTGEGTIYLQTSGSNRIAIVSDGNVGVGTISPVEKLEVSGSIKGGGAASSLYNFGSIIGMGDESSIYNFKNVTGRTADSLLHVAGGSGLDGTLLLNYNGGTVSIGGSTSGIFNVNAGGLYVNASKNVGIGNTSPDTNLSIIKSSGGLPASTGTTPTAAITRIKASANNAMFMGMDTASPYSGWIQVSDITGLGTNYPILLNPNGGNVGIGTTSPSYLLDVRANVAAASTPSITLRLNNQQDSGHRILFSNAATTTLAAIDGDIESSGAGTDDGILKFWTATNGSMTEKVRIDKDGNLGVGTITPATYGGIVLARNQNSDARMWVRNTDAGTSSRASYVVNASGNSWSMGMGSAANNGNALTWVLDIGGADSEKMRLDTSGNLGIGASASVTLGRNITLNGSSAGTNTGIIMQSNNVERGVIYGNSTQFALGSTTSIPTVFTTNNVERVRIDTSGNVGIGITSPSTQLHLSSSQARITLDSSDDSSAYTSAMILKSNVFRGSGLRFESKTTTPRWFAGIPYASNYTTYQIGYDALNSIPEYAASASLTIVGSSGNVGIGTTSPAHKLDVNGAISIWGGLIASASATYNLLYRRDGGVGIFLGGADAANYYDNNAHFFRDRSSNIKMYINSSTGDVGIGTTSPSNKLQVQGNVSASTYTSSISSGVGYFGTASYAVTASYALSAPGGGLSGGATNYIPLWTSATAQSSSNIYQSSGNIGIGTTSPQSILDVITPTNGYASFGRALSVGEWSGIHFGYREANTSYRKSAIVFERTDNGGGGGNAAGKVHILNGPAIGAGSATLTDVRLTIGETGNVGIGTTSPVAKLHVQTAVSKSILISDASHTTLTSNLGSAITFSRPSDGSVDLAGIFSWNNGGLAIGARQGLVLATGGSSTYSATVEAVRIDTSGNVGIGTTSPGRKLDVIGNALIGQNSNSSTTARLDITAGGSGFNSFIDFGFYETFDAGCWHVGRSGSSGAFYISDYATTGNELNAVTITTARNVGIGTITPATKLDVNGGISIGGGQVISASATYTQLIRRDGSVGIYLGGVGDPNNYYDNTNHYFRSITGATTRMIINSTGNVGIGTTAPQYKLHVSGGLSLFNSSTAGSDGNSGIRIVSPIATTHYNWMVAAQQNVGDAFEITPSTAVGGTTFSSPTAVFTATGRVGIGTTSPGSTLHIQGNVSASSYTSSISNGVGYFGTASFAVSASWAPSTGTVTTAGSTAINIYLAQTLGGF